MWAMIEKFRMFEAGAATAPHYQRMANPLDVLRQLVGHLDRIDTRSARTLMSERDEALDRIGRTLRDKLDGAVGPVRDPPAHAQPLRFAAGRVAEEDALDAPADDDTPPYALGRLGHRSG